MEYAFLRMADYIRFMRGLMFCSILLILTSCAKDGPDGYHALSEDQRSLLPLLYEPGDTLTFLYSKSSQSRSEQYVAGPLKNFLKTATGRPREANHHERYETLLQELSSLDGRPNIELAVGYMGYGSPYGGQYFNFSYQNHKYITPLSRVRNNSDTVVYRLWIDNPYFKRDSVTLQYSAYSGIVHLSDTLLGFELERLP